MGRLKVNSIIYQWMGHAIAYSLYIDFFYIPVSSPKSYDMKNK